MEVRFGDATLHRLEADAKYDAGLPAEIVTMFRKRMQTIRAAVDERDFYQLKSLRFEKLKGNRSHQHSVRLNDQWRLILQFEGEAPKKVVVVVAIEDYH